MAHIFFPFKNLPTVIFILIKIIILLLNLSFEKNKLNKITFFIKINQSINHIIFKFFINY